MFSLNGFKNAAMPNSTFDFNYQCRALFMSFKLGVLIALFAYSFLTVGAYPSIYIVGLEKLGVLEHPKHPR